MSSLMRFGMPRSAAPKDVVEAPAAHRKERKALGDISNRVTDNINLTKKPKLVHKAPRGMEVDQDVEEKHAQNVMPAPRPIPANVEDVYEDDFENPQMVAEYVEPIFEYMRELEVRLHVPANYFKIQTEINARMRDVLVDWLAEVHHRFELIQETFHLTVHLLDRYLSKEPVTRDDVQLVGITAMMVAAKYEEMYPPELGDYVYITDKAYSEDRILAMERKLLRVLDFSLGKPLPLHFLRRNSKAGHADATMHSMGKYMIELSLGSHAMLKYVPSQLAAAATYISREIVGEHELWNPTLEHYAKYSLEDIAPVVHDMRAVLKHSTVSRLQAIRNKFCRSRYLRVSKNPQLNEYIERL
ncbi:cyclin B [Salpingoeca rosetta]|uniref:Cyclin B n=1 Tax=Salpingoeca rosetta (strain ATCC 50818 / BSB-021) TaxID=946362 RepID=F2UD53_SALR5|nr:cyclin B [Salpingoeca rosetta]EGD74548.1 cyclin B [Salpingoeca rosetta]|eukprot:XP_004992805.1 cyclin B [Salpingoeca rosetta]